MTKPRFNIGDTAWVAYAGQTEVWIQCPHCFSEKYLTVILGDKSQITIDCECCKAGYEGCKGMIKTYEFKTGAQSIVINKIEWSDHNCEFQYNYKNDKDVFATEAEALVRAMKLKMEQQQAEKDRLEWMKENPKKSWAWNATYHRKQLKDAQRNVEYHTKKLAVALEHKKEEPKVETIKKENI